MKALAPQLESREKKTQHSHKKVNKLLLRKRIHKGQQFGKKKEIKRLVEIKQHDVFKDQFANIPFMEELGNNGLKVYSVRSGPRQKHLKVRYKRRWNSEPSPDCLNWSPKVNLPFMIIK